MMTMSKYVAWRLFAAKSDARNLRIERFVRSGMIVRYGDTSWSAQRANIHC